MKIKLVFPTNVINVHARAFERAREIRFGES